MATTHPHPTPERARTTSGWVTFAALYLVIAGALNCIWGITALSKKTYFHEDGLVWSNLSFWGTIALIAAAAQLLAAYLVWSRRLLGMIVALVVAMVAILVNFMMIGAYPIWSCIAIVCNGLVLWAVTVHGEQST
jgi:hypothetical protein